MWFQPLLFTIIDLFKDLLTITLREESNEISHMCDGVIWDWVVKRWRNFLSPDVGAKLLGIKLFQDDYVHFAFKNRAMKNLALCLGNGVSFKFFSDITKNMNRRY